MATYNYTKVGNKIVAEQTGGEVARAFPYHQFLGIGKLDDEGTAGDYVIVSFSIASYSFKIFPSVDIVILDGVTIAAGSKTVDELFDELNESSVFLDASAGGGGSVAIANNSRVVYFGDSITGQGFASSGTTSSFATNGFPNWLNLFAAQKLYMPIGGNLGVSGNSTTQMVARLGAALALKPHVVTFMGGTNDLASLTSAQTIANVKRILDAFIAINSTVFAFTILPRFSPNALSGANETKRQEINTWLKSYASTKIIVIDCEADLNNTINFSDGLHPNQTGAYKIGQLGSNALNNLLLSSNITDALLQDNTYTTNIELTGTAGAKNAATGDVATSWALLANNSGGATVVGSKLVESSLNKQVITLSGNYTGTGRVIQMYQDFTGTQPETGSIVEGFAEIEITSALNNVVGIYMQLQAYTAGYASTLANAYSMLPPSNETLLFPIGVTGKFILRTTPALLTGTTAIMSNIVNIELKTVGVSTPISGVIKIHKIGVRKVL